MSDTWIQRAHMGFYAANGRLSMSSGPHPCFPLLEMMMGLTGACQQLYIHLFKRAVGFRGVKITHLHPDSSLEVSRALHGTLHMPNTITVHLLEF